MTDAPGTTGDLAARRLFTVFVWILPPVAIVSAGLSRVTEPVLTAVWSLGFLVMGVGCMRNALRCGRVHCWFTGPLFLLAALGSLLLGTGVLPFGVAGWNGLGLAVAVGGVGLYYVPERIFGRYFGRDP